MDKKIKEIILREKEKGLFMSRVPKQIRNEFVNFAEEEFCGDRGMCLKHIWDNYKISKILVENNNMKLDLILSKLNTDEESSSIKLLDGKVIKEVKK